jgi:hypothetical protein
MCAGATQTLSISNNQNPAAGNPWSSSNTSIVQVNASGQVTAISPGSASITFTSSNGCIGTFQITVTELKGGKWYALDTNISAPSSPVPPLISGTPLGLGNGISYLVDENLNPIKWKTLWKGGGTYEYGVTYTSAQITGLEKLIRDLMQKYNIPFKWEGKKTYDQMFTKAGTYGNGGSNKGTPGVYTHTMVNPKSKADLLPTKEIVAMLQKFK